MLLLYYDDYNEDDQFHESFITPEADLTLTDNATGSANKQEN